MVCVYAILMQRNGRLPGQPTYMNSSVSPSHSSQTPPTGLISTPIGLISTPSSEVRSVSPSPSSHSSHGGGADRIKQMEREIHLLRMSVNDKDAQLTQVRAITVMKEEDGYESVLGHYVHTCGSHSFCLIIMLPFIMILSCHVLSLSPPPFSLPPPLSLSLSLLPPTHPPLSCIALGSA